MGKSVAVFAGRNGLDFWEVRMGVLRIPEVLGRLREAQKILDELPDLQGFDLITTVSSLDEHFNRNIRWKSLLSAIVQIGLYDRFVRINRKPSYLIGVINSDSALSVCAGQVSFADLIQQSEAIEALRAPKERPELVLLSAPILSGISIAEHQCLMSVETPEQSVEWQIRSSGNELDKLAQELHNEGEASLFINIGPAGGITSSDPEMAVIDCIEMDPMLGWFWKDIRSGLLPLAQ